MDYDRLRLAEMAAISEFLHELEPEQWNHPSLCDGWRVRDVISHMCVGYTTPMPTMIVKIAQDIRRPLDQPRALPEDRLVAALDVIPTTLRDSAR